MRRTLLMLGALVVVAVVTLAACGSSSKSASSTGKFCDLVKQYNSDKSLNAQPTNLADAKKQVQAVKSAIDNLAAAAPPAIKSEMQTLARVSDDLANATKNATSESDFARKEQAVQAKSKAASAASTKVGAYAKQHCGATGGSGG